MNYELKFVPLHDNRKNLKKTYNQMAKKALLMILDGWGIGKHGKGDVIYNTPTPYLDYLQAVSSTSQLQASGEGIRICQEERQETSPHGLDI